MNEGHLIIIVIGLIAIGIVALLRYLAWRLQLSLLNQRKR